MNQRVSTGLGASILLVMAFTAGYFIWMIEKNNQQEFPIPSLPDVRSTKSESAKATVIPPQSEVTESLENITSNAPSNWPTYINDTYKFEFKYPKGWRAEGREFNNRDGSQAFAVGVGDYDLSQDDGWLVTVYPINDKNDALIEELIANDGIQFKDRQEKREMVTINGVQALKVTITKKQYDDWISEEYIFKRNNGLFIVGNGAVTDDPFLSFISSFKFH